MDILIDNKKIDFEKKDFENSGTGNRRGQQTA